MISSFAVSDPVAACSDDRTATVPLSFSWAVEGADQVWIGIGGSDASAQPFAEVSSSASDYTDIEFECRDAEQIYTLTARGAGGITSATVAVERTLP